MSSLIKNWVPTIVIVLTLLFGSGIVIAPFAVHSWVSAAVKEEVKAEGRVLDVQLKYIIKTLDEHTSVLDQIRGPHGN